MDKIRKRLSDKGLKVTPQRLEVLKVIVEMGNHPFADEIINKVRKKHPNIATGTVYKILDVLSEKKIISKVKTDHDMMRYDGDTGMHHHLYCTATNNIHDYYDEELDQCLRAYFSGKDIEGFTIENISLQLTGRSIRTKEKKHD